MNTESVVENGLDDDADGVINGGDGDGPEDVVASGVDDGLMIVNYLSEQMLKIVSCFFHALLRVFFCFVIFVF